ncbi:MAG: CDP-diacylglycerol--glycerol-3-phosphate 3-phosphatidyltransferase [Verrucomicrobiaceae bacterium]|nr:CDP-diacylglycerol--glycerol-3-phosphate 3-phosphatidyltransferase [Verrucomicrobiaceae bacterium]NRB44889.1 CDP-diacylglycerol--glycerol-3-phosphate 3-phosphatidyltransferase [Verrucomicrobiales bacterium]|tara:strand:+ start:822 stop:1412 length:591 start_codon:yes stop_codon:yes gene_type:complete
MNLPNKLTIGRVGMTGLFVMVMSFPDSYIKENQLPDCRITVALIFFLIASITDFLDGYFARKLNLVTDFGKLMDPLVDKILTSAVFIILTKEEMVPAWITITIIGREFLVTGLRLLASNQGSLLSADSLGKWKTASQIITATYFLIAIGSDEKMISPLTSFQQPFIGNVLLIICTMITVISGASYLIKNFSLIKTD